MLNCCIEHKKARDSARKDVASENGLAVPQASPGKSRDSWSDSEDEFFECLSDAEDMKDVPADGVKGAAGKIKPEGRLQPHGKLTLLNSNEPLYIPVTQVSRIDERSTFTVFNNLSFNFPSRPLTKERRSTFSALATSTTYLAECLKQNS